MYAIKTTRYPSLQVHDQGVPGVGRAAEGLQLALPLLRVGEHLPAPRHPPVAGVLPLGRGLELGTDNNFRMA